MTTAREVLDKSMSELDFARAVVDLALSCGWKVRQEPVWRAATRKDDSAKGFPDLVLVREGRLIFAELKREKGKPSAPQEEWLTALRAHSWNCGALGRFHVAVWRPSDWLVIERLLR